MRAHQTQGTAIAVAGPRCCCSTGRGVCRSDGSYLVVNVNSSCVRAGDSEGETQDRDRRCGRGGGRACIDTATQPTHPVTARWAATLPGVSSQCGVSHMDAQRYRSVA